jgi:uncharacterized protein (DUF58 family)
MSKKALTSTIIILIFLLFFFLFAPVYYIRYLCLFFIGAIVVTFLYSKIIALFITVKHQDDVIRSIKLQDMTIRLILTNRSFIPISYFKLVDATGELFAEKNAFLVNLGPFETKTISFNCKGHQRGEYFLGPVDLKGSDPLGFYTWKKRVDTRTRVIVYPSIYPIELINSQGLPAGSISVTDKMYEDVTQFRSLREYVPGDDMKRINWKASAKTSKLYTMEFDSTLYFPVLILLNFCADDYPVRYRNQNIERAAEVAASLAFYYANLKQEMGFIATGTLGAEEESVVSVQNKSGYEHAQEILEVIAKLKTIKGTTDFNTILFASRASIPMGTKVLVVSPRIREEQAQSLIAAKRRGINIQILQIESSSERKEDDHIKGAMKVISVKEMGQDRINE